MNAVRDFPNELHGVVDERLYRRLEQLYHLIYELQQVQRETPTQVTRAIKQQLQLIGVLREPLVGQEAVDPQLTAAATVPGTLTSINGTGGGNVTVTTTTDPSSGAASFSVTLTSTPSFTTVDVSSGYKVGGVQVVGPQGPAIPDAVGGATIDVEARVALNAWLAQARSDGKIA